MSATYLTQKMEQDEGIPLPPKARRVKQGIVSILGSDTERNKAGSIRRTLSADMSSKKWLSQNGLISSSPIKKIASSEELAFSTPNDHFSSSSDGEEDHDHLTPCPAQDDVWNSIQNNNKQPPVGVWTSILSQKKEDDSHTPPYIHPLLKKSSSLNEKSLEICTESLGSETGSDQSFSSYPPSEIGEDKDDQQQDIFSHSFEEIPVVKYNKRSTSPPKSFPPPITSLAREDKPCVHMQSHRQNGRLILEAVSVPPQNLFRAQRVDGRLLLTLIAPTTDHAEFEKVFDDDIEEPPQLDYDGDDGSDVDEEEEEEEYEQENGTKGMQIVLEKNPNGTLMMKQLMGLDKKDHLKWSNTLNKAINLPHQLISPPSATASFNAYEYFWRKNPTTIHLNNYNDKEQVVQAANYSTALNANTTTTKITSYEQQDLVLMRGNNKENIDYLMPFFKGCKDTRRSLLIWEPYCIATS